MRGGGLASPKRRRRGARGRLPPRFSCDTGGEAGSTSLDRDGPASRAAGARSTERWPCPRRDQRVPGEAEGDAIPGTPAKPKPRPGRRRGVGTGWLIALLRSDDSLVAEALNIPRVAELPQAPSAFYTGMGGAGGRRPPPRNSTGREERTRPGDGMIDLLDRTDPGPRGRRRPPRASGSGHPTPRGTRKSSLCVVRPASRARREGDLLGAGKFERNVA